MLYDNEVNSDGSVTGKLRGMLQSDCTVQNVSEKENFCPVSIIF